MKHTLFPHAVASLEVTNKGRREKKARQKDNKVKETLGRRGRRDRETFQSCKVTNTGNNAMAGEEKRN